MTPARGGWLGWLALSLVLALAYSIPGLRLTLGDEQVVADDARLHVFWMQRFEQPSLFPDDLIADYYDYLVPPGYSALYYVFSTVGFPPLLFNKILPSALVLLGAGLTFVLLIQMTHMPRVAFVGSAIMSQLSWMKDDIPSGTPRAFAYALLLALLVALARRRVSPGSLADGMVVAILVAHALIYPSAALVGLGVVVMVVVKEAVSADRRQYVRQSMLAAISTLAVIAILLPSVRRGPYGALYETSVTRGMPEYAPAGRYEYWSDDPWEFWLLGPSSGLVTDVRPSIALCGTLLPLMLLRANRFPLASKLRHVELLLLPLLSGLGLFVAAHALFPSLYFPSRYVHYSLRVVLAPAAAIAIALAVDRLKAGAGRKRAFGTRAVVAAVAVVVLAYPLFAADYPVAAFHRTRVPELHRFLRTQPEDTVVASLSALADDIPTFAARSVLVSPHYAIPLHQRYYDLQRERAIDLLAGQYTDDPQRLMAVLRRWKVDYWLIDAGFDLPSYLGGSWLRQFQPAAVQSRAFLERGGVPVLTTLRDCTVMEDRGFRLLDARCLLAAAEKLPAEASGEQSNATILGRRTGG